MLKISHRNSGKPFGAVAFTGAVSWREETAWEFYIRVLVNVNWVLIFFPSNLLQMIWLSTLPLWNFGADNKQDSIQHLIANLFLSFCLCILKASPYWDKSAYLTETVGKILQINLSCIAGGAHFWFLEYKYVSKYFLPFSFLCPIQNHLINSPRWIHFEKI